MERLKLRYKDAERAIGTLKDIMEQPFSIIVRDAAVQRFEYTFEAVWKCLKEYLKVQEGTICNSPKSCFRDALGAKLLQEEETVKFLEMTDDRNMTSHTYKEEVSHILYEKMNDNAALLGKLISKIEEKLQYSK